MALAPAPAMGQEARAPVQRVLVVDDDFFVRAALARELMRSEFRVVLAEGYEQARKLLDITEGICAVVSDLEMGPGPDGIDLLGEIKETRPMVPRILVSGSPCEGKVEHAIQGGVLDRFITKPWGTGEVLAAIRGALR